MTYAFRNAGVGIPRSSGVTSSSLPLAEVSDEALSFAVVGPGGKDFAYMVHDRNGQRVCLPRSRSAPAPRAAR